jgi:hypothetical protein
MKIYISGPITGMKNLNSESFSKAEKLLTMPGTHPVNPLNIPSENKSWQGHMKADIAELINCDYIAMLPGWWHSKGSVVEILIAKILGIKILLRWGFRKYHD